jgi:hypothetical protein
MGKSASFHASILITPYKPPEELKFRSSNSVKYRDNSEISGFLRSDTRIAIPSLIFPESVFFLIAWVKPSPLHLETTTPSPLLPLSYSFNLFFH